MKKTLAIATAMIAFAGAETAHAQTSVSAAPEAQYTICLAFTPTDTYMTSMFQSAKSLGPRTEFKEHMDKVRGKPDRSVDCHWADTPEALQPQIDKWRTDTRRRGGQLISTGFTPSGAYLAPAPAKVSGGGAIIVKGPSQAELETKARAERAWELAKARDARQREKDAAATAAAKARRAELAAAMEKKRAEFLAKIEARKRACAAGDKTQCGSQGTPQ